MKYENGVLTLEPGETYTSEFMTFELGVAHDNVSVLCGEVKRLIFERDQAREQATLRNAAIEVKDARIADLENQLYPLLRQRLAELQRKTPVYDKARRTIVPAFVAAASDLPDPPRRPDGTLVPQPKPWGPPPKVGGDPRRIGG